MKIADYQDKWGLVQPEPDGRSSDNGVRFTSEAIIGLKLNGMDVPESLYTALKQCEPKPGMLIRHPGNSRQDSIDNYTARLHVSACRGDGFSVRFLARWASTGGVFLNSEPTLKNFLSAMFIRFPQLKAQAMYASGKTPPWWLRAYVFAVILRAAFSKGQDDKCLSWHLMQTVRLGSASAHVFISRPWHWLFGLWRKRLAKQYPDGIGGVLAEYFHPEHDKHPNAMLLKGAGLE